jgi:hypothetical protein
MPDAATLALYRREPTHYRDVFGDVIGIPSYADLRPQDRAPAPRKVIDVSRGGIHAERLGPVPDEATALRARAKTDLTIF